MERAAVESARNTFPASTGKQGAGPLCKDGRLYTGHGVTFADGVALSACDPALANALSDGRQKCLTAFCGKTPPGKASFARPAPPTDTTPDNRRL